MKNKKIIGLEHNSISPDITGIENNDSIYLHMNRGVDSFLTVYVDESIKNISNNCKHNIAMLVEPISVSAELYSWIKQNYDNFDLVLTHHKPLLQISSKFKYYPVWPRIKMDNNNRIISEKTKLISAIFSNKRITSAQKFRHTIADQFKDTIDLYGTGYKFIEDKFEGTGNYMFQIVVENIFSGYVSEKGNDCFANGTIPIYYGNSKSNINDYYDMDGVILFETIDELQYILNKVATVEYYNSKKLVIDKNYKLAIQNNVHETIWNAGVKNFFK
jgi:hypothetical protein|tara:strand:- start:4419 stop:5240 length:822 start_codon:yes stop_codon:yes gene_type:complete